MNLEKTILIVDDEETNIHVLMELLDEKYDILATLDSLEVSEILEEEKVDLILLDIMMPNIDGYEVCKRVKNNPLTKHIPIIFITAQTDKDSIEKAYEAGAVDFISKPFNAREIQSRIHAYISL